MNIDYKTSIKNLIQTSIWLIPLILICNFIVENDVGGFQDYCTTNELSIHVCNTLAFAIALQLGRFFNMAFMFILGLYIGRYFQRRKEKKEKT